MNINFRLLRRRYCVTVTRHYCGAITTELKPREGEKWLRGRDLRDGPLWKAPRVLLSVIACELRHF